MDELSVRRRAGFALKALYTWRPRRAAIAVLALGVGWSVAAFVLTSLSLGDSEAQLLKTRATEATAVIQSLTTEVESAMVSVASVVRQPGGAGFSQLAQATKAGGSAFAVLQTTPTGALVLGSAGTLEGRPVLLSGALSPVVQAAAARSGFQLVNVIESGGHRTLALLLSGADIGPGDILYAEIRLPSAAALIKESPQAAFSGLDFSVFLGSREDDSSLLFANVSQIPLTGSRAMVVASTSTAAVTAKVGDAARAGTSDAGAGDLLLVFRAQGYLGGGLTAASPWLIAGFVLLTAFFIAAAVTQALRRRDAALAHAAQVQAALDTAADAERNLQHIFDDHPNPLWVYDMQTLRFLAVNDATVRRYGWSREELLQKTILDIRPPEEVLSLQNSLHHHGAVVERSGPWRHRLRDGRDIWVEITSHEQEFAGRHAALVLAQDVTERRSLEEQLRHQALHDSLTGLPNRALFADRAEQALGRSRRTRRNCAVLLIDIDDFKAVNDSLGHVAGDALLVQVAARLREQMRASDSAARLGGDEFGVLLEDVSGDAGAMVSAQRLVDALSRPYDVADTRVTTSASVGIALSASDTTRFEDLLRNADVAMYGAKAAGKGRYEVYEKTRHLQVSELHTLQNQLSHAVANNELAVVYQPQVDLRTRALVGVEALVRWHHPQRGVVGPDVFIPIAERNGVIHEIDEWVLETACRQVEQWAVMGLGRLRVAVNVSGRDLDDDNRLVTAVARTLDSTGIRAGDVEIELTESVAVAQHARALAILKRLRQLRVRLAIDDFGTGYSALSRLRDFPPDRIKIDRSFIAGIDRDGHQRALVSAMISMGHTVGLTVLAEGVETPAELSFLISEGCDEVQGYLISRPLPAANMEDLLRQQGDDWLAGLDGVEPLTEARAQ